METITAAATSRFLIGSFSDHFPARGWKLMSSAKSTKFSLGKPFPIISPQGDGNEMRLVKLETKRLFRSFPRKGMETLWTTTFPLLLMTCFSDHFPARGWKPSMCSEWDSASTFPIISPQGDGNTAFGWSWATIGASAFPIISPQGDGNKMENLGLTLFFYVAFPIISPQGDGNTISSQDT